jgi:flagellar hook protein FlgE
VTFDNAGVLTAPAAGAPVAIAVSGLANGAADLAMNWELYTAAGVPRLSQYTQTSGTAANTQNGAATAALTGVALADGGRIVAKYSNGEQRIVAQVALAGIRNPESMIAVGNNNYVTSATTALPAIGLADTGGRGKIFGGSIEYSTVDIAREFTNLIVYQRGYQASTRVVTTVDEISQETINIKR